MLAHVRRNALELRRIAGESHVSDEFHVAAERQPSELPAGPLPVRPACKLAAKADRESLGRNAEQTGHEIVAEFVKKDERAKRADERDQHEPEWWLGKHR